MDQQNNQKQKNLKSIVISIVALIVIAGLIGWKIGHSHKNTDQAAGSQNSSQTGTLNSVVSYSIPSGWKESSCSGKDGAYITPPGTSLDCTAELPAPVMIAVDGGNTTDCAQLQSVQNVSKHICKSQYIHGHKSLNSETVYNTASVYKKATSIEAYYINTGKGIVKVVYQHNTSDMAALAGFGQLAESVQTK